MASAERGQSGTWQYLALWNPDGSIDLKQTLVTLPASDRDAAELADGYWPEQVFYEPGKNRVAGRWYLWDGQCQRPDYSRQIEKKIMLWTHMLDKVFTECRQQLSAEISARMTGQPKDAVDKAIAAAWLVWTDSKQWAYSRGLRGTAQAGRLRDALATITGTDTTTWPDHPLLLNVANCVVSLEPGKTGWEWCPHDPALRMTYCLRTSWLPTPDGTDPLSRCPRFAWLLWRACGEQPEVFRYLIHVLGYALLGDNRYQVIFFLSGPTASGKSTLLEIVSTVLEDLAHEAKPDLVVKTARERHGRHEASIRGKRLVTIGETNDQLRLDENQLKSLTGQKRLSVDIIYRDELTGTLISALIMIANNDMPEVAHLDEALTRRIWVIPMGETIPEWERDASLAEQIAAEEAEGILALLVGACREVTASGGALINQPPAAVAHKTESYKREQNTARLWLADCTVPANGQVSAQKGSSCRKTYIDWCADQQKIALGLHHFYAELARLPGVTRSGGEDQAWFFGFVLKNPPEDD